MEGVGPVLLSMRQAVIYPGEDGMWVAEVPSLPGCVTQGATRAEAIENVREAIDLWVEVMRKKTAFSE